MISIKRYWINVYTNQMKSNDRFLDYIHDDEQLNMVESDTIVYNLITVYNTDK